ncbi:MAG TPA: hypothetical protein VGM81_19405 [Burkholderiaceae bacterium]|jgi:hypothetical protein
MNLHIKLIALASIVLSGCSNFPVGQYAPSEQNRAALIAQGTEPLISVKAFTATKPNVTKLQCRGAGHLVFPSGESPEQYLTTALRKELMFANVYAENGPIQISGNVQFLDMNSNVFNAGWQFDVTFSNGADSFQLQYLHTVKTSWMAERACGAVAEQFVEATQALIQKAITNPTFVGWRKAAAH